MNLCPLIPVREIFGLMDICKAENFRGVVLVAAKSRIIAVLAKRSRALLESNSTRNSQSPIYQWEDLVKTLNM